MRYKTLYILTILFLLAILNNCKHNSLGDSKDAFETAIQKAATDKLTMHQFIMNPTVKSILVKVKGDTLYQRLLSYSKYSTNSVVLKDSVYTVTGWLTVDRGCQMIYDTKKEYNSLHIYFLNKKAKTDEQGHFINAGLWEKHYINENDTLSNPYLMLSLLNTEQGGKDTLQLILYNQDLILYLRGQNDKHKIDEVMLRKLSKDKESNLDDRKIWIDKVKDTEGYPLCTQLYRVYLSNQVRDILPTLQNDSAQIIIKPSNLCFFISSKFTKYQGAVQKYINKHNFFKMSNRVSTYGIFTPEDLSACYNINKLDDFNTYMQGRGFHGNYYSWSSSNVDQSVSITLEEGKVVPESCEFALSDHSQDCFKKRMQFAGYRVIEQKNSEYWMHTDSTGYPKTVHFWFAGVRGIPCFDFTYK